MAEATLQGAPGARTVSASRSRTWASTAALAAGFAVALAATRIPFAGRYLFDWDSLQFALGTTRFDLAAHRPHPPGYIGYVAAGRLLKGVFGDVNTGLVALSIGTEGLAVAGIFLAADRLFGRFAGVAAAALLLTSPLFWLYGETALTYGLEPALSLLGFWLVLRAAGAAERRSAPAAKAPQSATRWLAAGLVVGLIGAIRPSTEFFLLPLLAMAAWRDVVTRPNDAMARRWPVAPAALLGLAAGTTAWLVPLLVLSGGPLPYLRATAALGHRVSGGSAIWRAGLPGLLLDSRAVLDGLGLSLGLYLPLLVGVVLTARLVRRPQAAPRLPPILVAAWLLPALLTFVLVHIGELAYVLYLVPGLLLAAGPALDRTAALLAGGRRTWQPRLRIGLLVACVSFNAISVAAPVSSPLQVVTERDRHVAALLAAVRAYPPAATVLVADPEGPSSYRTAMWYLPEYPLVAVGRDSGGRAGEMFSNRAGAPEYELSRFDHVGPLRLPTEVTALVLDRAVLDSISDPERLDALPLPDDPGARIYSVRLDPADPPQARGGWIALRGSDRLKPRNQPFRL